MNGSSRGFTLLEMVVVLAVIAILAAILTPIITSYVQRSQLNAAHSDLKNIAAAVVQFNTDTKVWPIYSGAFTSLQGTVYDVDTTTGTDAILNGSGGYTAGSSNGDLDGLLNKNSMALPTAGSTAWKGAYLELGSDPWGTRYYLTSKHLKPGDTNMAFVLSAGPDQTINTSTDQAQSGSLTVGGDDLAVRIK